MRLAAGTHLGVYQIQSLLGGYMSPEQARGQAVDKRADIWAFGCVLYEMLTGKLAFGGATLSDTLAAVIEREPDWKALPAATRAAVRQLVRRCLAKPLGRRLRDIGDACSSSRIPRRPRTHRRSAIGRGAARFHV